MDIMNEIDELTGQLMMIVEQYIEPNIQKEVHVLLSMRPVSITYKIAPISNLK